jgi:sec-independent protein translocase protein TatB
MFGMGFMEIFLVLIVAIIALGPEKLPTALVDMARFFKKIKGEIDEAKTTINNELDISQMKKDAQEFKESISDIQSLSHISLDDVSAFQDEEKKIKVNKEKKLKEKDSKKETISINTNVDKEV